ncbi:MAG: FUSC family protein [Beijerinckiaceae bacterium]
MSRVYDKASVITPIANGEGLTLKEAAPLAPGSPQNGWLAAPRVASALRSAGPLLLFGLRLWASVCLALYVAFWLELDNPFWAGTTAAIVCQPQLGASLRKGWYRMVGTCVGAVAIVVLTAWFPQDRAPFLVALALWAAACAFVATLLHNYASYAAGLAGYTAAIIAADVLGATGGPNADAVFLLAVFRANEICLGIVCAGAVLAGTDFGGARRRLAALFAALSAEITGRFTGMLALAGPGMPETRPARRELVRRIIALDPVIDVAKGESSQLRYHSTVLQRAVDGLFAAQVGWRTVAVTLARLPDDTARQEANAVLQSIPQELRSAEHGVAAGWMADPVRQRRACEVAVRTLSALPAGTPAVRLLADHTAKVMAGISDALNGMALLVAAPVSPTPRRHGFRLRVPDWLPSLVNAGRAFVAIGIVALFWIATEWPNGALAITFAAIGVVLFAPRADQAYASALGFMAGTTLAVVPAAIVNFVVLPGLETFEAFSIAIGLYLVPAGALMARPLMAPTQKAMFTYLAAYFVPLLAPANEMSYDTLLFYNRALAIVAGTGAAALSFRLMPPLSPAFRTRRLLGLTLRDLHRLATGHGPWTAEDWEGRIYGRLAVVPDAAEPLQRAQLMTALTVGNEIIHLRQIVSRLGLDSDLDAALAPFAQGNSAIATARLAQLDDRFATLPGAGSEAPLALQARGNILAISEALGEHAAYFDAGGPG